MLTLSVVMLVGPIENTFWHYSNFNNVVFICVVLRKFRKASRAPKLRPLINNKSGILKNVRQGIPESRPQSRYNRGCFSRMSTIENMYIVLNSNLMIPNFPHNIRIKLAQLNFFCCTLTLLSLCPVGCLSLEKYGNSNLLWFNCVRPNVYLWHV